MEMSLLASVQVSLYAACCPPYFLLEIAGVSAVTNSNSHKTMMTPGNDDLAQPRLQRDTLAGQPLTASRPTQRWDMGILSTFALIFFSLSFFYFLNILRWGDGPDFGWYVGLQADHLLLIEVFGEAEKAGLQVGDRILRVNNAEVASLQQIRQVRNADAENHYEVERQGQVFMVTVPAAILAWIFT